jgi:hypothetical protein
MSEKRAKQFMCDQCKVNSPCLEVGARPPSDWYLVMTGEDLSAQHFCGLSCLQAYFRPVDIPAEQHAYHQAASAVLTTPRRCGPGSPEAIAERAALAAAAERIQTLFIKPVKTMGPLPPPPSMLTPVWFQERVAEDAPVRNDPVSGDE